MSIFNHNSIIDYSRTHFHNPNIPPSIALFNDNTTHFGIFEIKIKDIMSHDIDMSIPIHIFLSIDCSESMNDICNDGKTKLEHMKQTIKNILSILHKNKDITFSIQAQTFDENITKLELDLLLDLDVLLVQIDELTANNSTNIEVALRNASEEIKKYKEKNPSYEITHIFLTDGEITEGKNDYNTLLSLVPTGCSNIFIGYGEEHDVNLLSHLASNRRTNQYRFIDQPENAGLVYGEIIHSIIYKAIEDVRLEVEYGEIYDFFTNKWEQEINIGNLLMGQKKTFYIRSKHTNRFIISVIGKNMKNNTINKFLNNSNTYDIQATAFKHFDDIEPDLNAHMFRQKAQVLLYISKEFSKIKKTRLNRLSYEDELNCIKSQLNMFYKIMKHYINIIKPNNNRLQEFIDMLCDDIYIAYKSIGTTYGNMYTISRQLSNGLQQTYLCNPIIPISGINFTPTELLSSNYNPYMRFNDLQIQTQTQPKKNIKYDIERYIPSKKYISPYKTNETINLMREVSGKSNIDTFKTKTLTIVKLEDLV
jgi:uncharacterized protein YegL